MNVAPYNSERLSMLKQLLINYAENGKPSDYEIRVDDMKVVPRTNDVEHFDNYQEFVNEDTTKVVVLIYDGASRRNNRYTFLMKEEPKDAKKQDSLNGVETLIQQERKQWQYELLEKENKDLKKKVDEAEDYIEQLTGEIEKLKAGRKAEELNWGQMLGIAGESMLRRNTHLLAKVPGMQGLAGIIDEDSRKNETQQIETKKSEAEASFKMKEESDQEHKPELTEEDKQRIDFIRELQTELSEEEFKQVMTMLNILLEKKKAIEPTLIYAIQWKEIVSSPAMETKVKADEVKNETAQAFTVSEEKSSEEKQRQELPENKEKHLDNSSIEKVAEDELKDHTF